MRPLESRLADHFVDMFSSATKLHVVRREANIRFADEAGRQREVDLVLRVEVPEGGEFLLVVEIKQTVYPRDIRGIAELMDSYEGRLEADGETVPVLRLIAAQHLNQSVRRELQQAGIHFFDESGTLSFEHGTRLVHIERPPAAPPERRIGSIFSGAREQVVHAMLHHWHLHGGTRSVSGIELAALAKTSVYTVSKTLQEMDKQGWLHTEGSGPAQRRRVRQPAAVLAAWAQEWSRRSEERTRWYVYAGEGGLPRLLADGLMGSAGWAVTGAAAANQLVPHLSRVDRVVLMVEPARTDDLANALRLERADEGFNVTVVERTGAAWLFADDEPKVSGLRLASAFVQYLDLLDGVGRNKELALELRERYLRIPEAHGD